MTQEDTQEYPSKEEEAFYEEAKLLHEMDEVMNLAQSAVLDKIEDAVVRDRMRLKIEHVRVELTRRLFARADQRRFED